MNSLDPKNLIHAAYDRDILVTHVAMVERNLRVFGRTIPIPAVQSRTSFKVRAREIWADPYTELVSHEGTPGRLLVAHTELGEAVYVLTRDEILRAGDLFYEWVTYALKEGSPWGLVPAAYIGKSAERFSHVR